MKIRTLLPGLALAAGLLLASCDSSMGIFYALEREVPIANNGNTELQKTVIKKISSSATHWFVQGSSRIFRTPIKAAAEAKLNKFTILPVPAGMREALSMAVASDNVLYAVFRADSASPARLYTSANGDSWTEIAGAAVGDYLPWDLVETGTSTVLLVNHKPGDASPYQLRRLDAGTLDNTYTSWPGTEHPRAVALDDNGTDYFVVTNNATDGRIYNLGNDITNLGVAPTVSTSPSHKYLSIISEGGRLVAVSYDGYVSTSADGSAWTTVKKEEGGSAVKFTSVRKDENSSYVLAGTMEHGLYTINTTTALATALPITYGNYSSATEMVKGNIIALGGGGTNQPIFSGTETSGLWSAFYEPDADGINTKEPGLVWSIQ